MNYWKKIRYKLEWFLCMGLAQLLPMISRKSSVHLANILGTVVFHLDKPRQAIALANLEAAFGNQYTISQRYQIAKASYRNFARTMIDHFWGRRITPDNYERYIKLENFQMLREIQQQQAGSVIICMHFGGFEWASPACGCYGLRLNIVAETFKNPLLSDVFNGLRERAGNRIIPQEFSMVRLLKHVKRGGMAGLLIDLNLKPTQASTVIEGFGMKMCVTFLHALLAQRAGALLIPVTSEPLPDGTCRMVAHSPLQFPKEASIQEIAQGCWDFFEPHIRRNPHLWMWAYKHWRYQPKDAVTAYPFYANLSPKFEKLLRSLNQPAQRKN